MRRRISVVVGLVACTLVGVAPALAGDPTSGPTARSDQHRNLNPQQTSDHERGDVAAPLPSFLRRATTSSSAPVTWRVAPGVHYTKWSQTDARGPIRAHLLTVSTRKKGVRIDYASVGGVRQTATVPDILARDKAVAGVNGDFYDIGHSGAPFGLGKDRQRGLLHGRENNGNAAFYIARNGRPDIGSLPMEASIVDHPRIKVTNLNSPAVAAGGVGIYTHAWGRTTGTGMTNGQQKDIRAVWVEHGKVVRNRSHLQTGKDVRGLLLVGRGRGAERLKTLHKGTPVRVHYGLPARPQMAITGSNYLVHTGIIQATDDRILQPRTAVGIDHDTGEVLFLVIDGRTAQSRGYTLVELADMMIDLGADEAINLDGGGSSTMVAKGQSGRTKVMNHPSDGFLRHVANAVEVTYTRPKKH
ncbi:phosphodiester glycosidase family protein [Nocardioides mangrovi]|uniref:Phosphodiester glycosidase family protein n=1 Tax=Nocardioides mangrovi TaxID=2874580 RepID=A0ABS7U9G3_9ACTN|nr:phosphodiester glycosidase family protein [Nocardioides mangrovi]MBZ5737619.1 phosphodiester glycosidase family protein [Nocardioides mangrovi]